MTQVAVDLFGNTNEEAIYLAAISEPLDVKVRKAIAYIREYEPMALSLDSRGYAVGDSFGKDSVVLRHLFKLAKVKHFCFHSPTTIDPPEVVRFGRDFHKDTLVLPREMHMLNYMVKHGKGLPTRMGRWCCGIYKESAFTKSFRALGVRAEESKARKGRWQTITIHSESNTPILSPVVYWTGRDIWEFIHGENLPFCCLYSEPGITRIGCVMCPLASVCQMKREGERWPGFLRLWQIKTKEFFNQWKDVPTRRGEDRAFKSFVTWHNYWDWWISGGANDSRQADCQMWLW